MLRAAVSASKPVSRVLSFKTAIYLDAPLPVRSSRLPGTVGPTICPSTALLRIEFTATDSSQPSGELLPHLSTLTGQRPADYFCCTFPRVAPGGCYPLSLPCGARTFLTDGPFAPPARLSSLLALPMIQENAGVVNRGDRTSSAAVRDGKDARKCTTLPGSPPFISVYFAADRGSGRGRETVCGPSLLSWGIGRWPRTGG